MTRRRAATTPVVAEEWTRDDVVAYLAELGRTVAPSSWSAYVTRGRAPEPVRYVGRTPVWSPADVQQWADEARGHGWRAGERAEQ